MRVWSLPARSASAAFACGCVWARPRSVWTAPTVTTTKLGTLALVSYMSRDGSGVNLVELNSDGRMSGFFGLSFSPKQAFSMREIPRTDDQATAPHLACSGRSGILRRRRRVACLSGFSYSYPRHRLAYFADRRGMMLQATRRIVIDRPFRQEWF